MPSNPEGSRTGWQALTLSPQRAAWWLPGLVWFLSRWSRLAVQALSRTRDHRHCPGQT
jgi:hypothetical protein